MNKKVIPGGTHKMRFISKVALINRNIYYNRPNLNHEICFQAALAHICNDDDRFFNEILNCKNKSDFSGNGLGPAKCGDDG